MPIFGYFGGNLSGLAKRGSRLQVRDRRFAGSQNSLPHREKGYSVCNHIRDKQIGLPLRGRPILLITRMITDRIGLHSVLLPLLIVSITSFGIKNVF